MAEFDPRRTPVRLKPRLVVGLCGLASLGLAWYLTASEQKLAAARPAVSAKMSALQHEAFAQAEAQPGFDRPENIALKIQRGETFEAAVRRAGVSEAEAREVVKTLGSAFDTVNIKAGLAFDAAIARPRDQRGPVRLIGLSMRTGPATALTLSRTFDGALKLREMEEQIRSETTVAQGQMEGSLYESAEKAGATPALTAQVVKLFGHSLDFSRDIQPGDRFKMVFDRKLTDSGRTVETGELLYAEIAAKGGVKRFYRFKEAGSGSSQYFDETGKNIRGFLLRTPVDGARMTSGFGIRRHPILGFNRMHQGIDFGVGTGTPVISASDGVVKEVRWNGGYGRWVRIRHAGGWETAYAHLSRWAKGIHPGSRVRQGQVIAYVGSTGSSTGPHLHYEVIHNGAKINPKGAKVPQGTVLAGRALANFRSEKSRIDHLLTASDARLAQAGPSRIGPDSQKAGQGR
jgi:murein DD-endopeptidase MepM/ murein hydrolase activator NlpD